VGLPLSTRNSVKKSLKGIRPLGADILTKIRSVAILRSFSPHIYTQEGLRKYLKYLNDTKFPQNR